MVEFQTKIHRLIQNCLGVRRTLRDNRPESELRNYALHIIERNIAILRHVQRIVTSSG